MQFISYVIRMSFIRHLYVSRMHLYVTCMPTVCHCFVLVCQSYVTRMCSYLIYLYSYAILMSLACTRMYPYVNRMYSYVTVCHLYLLVCHPYVTRMYLYVIRVSLVSTRTSSLCHSYVVLPWTISNIVARGDDLKEKGKTLSSILIEACKKKITSLILTIQTQIHRGILIEVGCTSTPIVGQYL